MAQNYARSYQKTIDERLALDALTTPIVNKNGVRLDFTGVNTVTIYTVDNLTQNNYQRSGTNRFGTLAEVGTSTEDYVLSQDKSATGSIDRGNLEDSMMVQESGSVLQRYIRETVVPNVDIYRLALLQAYAVANSLSATVALSSSNIYIKLLDAMKNMDDNKVPQDGRYIFVTPASYVLLMQDSNFIKASPAGQEMLTKGLVGEAAGFNVIKVPTSYLPANTGFLAVWNQVTVAAEKFKTYRTLTDVQGVDGWVVEARNYYDAWVVPNKAKGIWAHMNA